MKDLKLQVRTSKGQLVAKDTTYDTEFMMDIVEEIGKAICKAFHWVPTSEPIHLCMDNTEGAQNRTCKDAVYRYY